MRFLRDLVVVVVVFLVLSLISYIDLPVTQPVEEYLAYVVSTDMSVAPVTTGMEWVSDLLGEWNLTALLQGLPRITTGR